MSNLGFDKNKRKFISFESEEEYDQVNLILKNKGLSSLSLGRYNEGFYERLVQFDSMVCDRGHAKLRFAEERGYTIIKASDFIRTHNKVSSTSLKREDLKDGVYYYRFQYSDNSGRGEEVILRWDEHNKCTTSSLNITYCNYSKHTNYLRTNGFIAELREATSQEIAQLEICEKKGRYSTLSEEIDSWYVIVTEENKGICEEWRFGKGSKNTLIVGHVVGINNKRLRPGEKGHNETADGYFDYQISTEEFYKRIGHNPKKNSKILTKKTLDPNKTWVGELTNLKKEVIFKGTDDHGIDVSGEYVTSSIGFCNSKDIFFREATEEETDWLDRCIKAGKTVDRKKSSLSLLCTFCDENSKAFKIGKKYEVLELRKLGNRNFYTILSERGFETSVPLEGVIWRFKEITSSEDNFLYSMSDKKCFKLDVPINNISILRKKKKVKFKI